MLAENTQIGHEAHIASGCSGPAARSYGDIGRRRLPVNNSCWTKAQSGTRRSECNGAPTVNEVGDIHGPQPGRQIKTGCSLVLAISSTISGFARNRVIAHCDVVEDTITRWQASRLRSITLRERFGGRQTIELIVCYAL